MSLPPADHRRLLAFMLATAWAVVLAVAIGECSSKKAHAQTREQVELASAQVCYLESSFRHDDCSALLHVIGKRAGVHMRSGWPDAWTDANAAAFMRMLGRYSSLSSRTQRARAVRAFDVAPIDGHSSSFNRAWSSLLELVAQVFDGQAQDPCPRATQWGSRILASDRVRALRALDAGRWIPARCSSRTANAFYVEVRR